MKTWDDVQNTIRAEVELWFSRQCRNLYERHYCWFKPSDPANDVDAMILIQPERPTTETGKDAGFIPARFEPMHIGWTKDQEVYDLIQCFRSLPVLNER